MPVLPAKVHPGTSMMMAMMGTTKEATTAQISCLGVLIGPSWASWAPQSSPKHPKSTKKLLTSSK